ncbi:MAG: LptF/LptG family permease [Treponemataceae bacterium]|nr:LptF/LptG family permease [Treponemataceae bacterium]
MESSKIFSKIKSVFTFINEKILKTNSHVMMRYLVKELLLYFTIAFLFFFLVFFCNQILLLVQDILRKHVPLMQVMKLMSYSLPFIIAQSAPFGTLVGFLMCMGRLMTDNEILILRATGTSFFRLSLPVIILGVVISLGSFFVNDYLLPLGTIQYNKLYKEIIFSNPNVEMESNSIKKTSNSILVIGEVNDRNVSDLLLFDTDSDGNQRLIVAGNTELLDPNDSTIMMQLRMKNPSVIQFDNDDKDTYEYILSDYTTMNIFASQFISSGSSGTNPREMTSYDLKKYIDKLKTKKNTSKRTLNTYNLEYHKKFSLPFGSIFFALLAFPLAILFGKHNGQTIGLIIGILISVLYWSLMTLGQIFGLRNGMNGFISMWLPNLLVGIFGCIFIFFLVKK